MLTTKTRKTLLLAATGMAAAMICSPALAQDAAPQPSAADTAAAAQAEADSDVVVVVKGLRKSLKSAVDRKRNSKQIVDSIDAEDAGKLPDNNVIEALAHVTGIQITRARGEGSELMIRGQSDIQTTLNGSPNNAGVGRAASLNDIPAELLKSVQVYKTRTADQVEGGIGGTVNVDLRRPLDLKKGWTLAGSVRNVYGSIGNTESPYASALIAKRFDTPIGEMGILANLSYQETNYNEQYIRSETPQDFRYWTDMLGLLTPAQKAANLPGQEGNIISLYRTEYGVESGKVRRPSFNFAYQWRVNDQLDLLLETSSFTSNSSNSYSALNTRIKDFSDGRITDLVFMPDGTTLKSLRVVDINPTNGNIAPVGPTARDDFNLSKNNRINFELHWHNDRANINLTAYRDENSSVSQWYTQSQRLKGLTQYTVDFDSDKVPNGGPWVDYQNAAGQSIDVSDINNYNMFFLENGKNFQDSTETVFAADLTYRLSDDKFFRSFQAGVRHTDRDASQAYGYRYAYFGYDFGQQVDKSVSLLDFPGGTGYVPVTVDIDGVDAPTWYRISRDSLLGNFDAIRAYASTPSKTSETGGSGVWSDEVVSTEQLNGSFSSNEKTAAIYAQVNYAFTVGNVPIDGVAGVRSVHTWGNSISTQYKNGVATPVPFEGDYTDVLPNLTAVAHFTPKLQLRLAYTLNVQRPGFQDSSPFVMYDTVNLNGWGGNPDLKPNKETSYDASLEYYFGRGGILSAATYLKKPDNFIVYGRAPRVIDGVTYQINMPTNAGPAEYQGVELTAQGFFDFLPGPWNNFGASANLTYNTKAEIKYGFYNGEPVTQVQIDTIPGLFDAPNNSKLTYNLAVYYETPKFSARLAYNHRDRYRGYLDGYSKIGYSTYYEPTERLDMAINYTPVQYMTLSLEGTNLTEDDSRATYGQNALLPQGVRVGARTIQLSARFRY